MLELTLAHLTAALKAVREHRSGQTLVEYILVIAFVSITLIVALEAFGPPIADLISSVGSEL